MARRFLVALGVAGVLLGATVVPGVFTVDEDNYLVSVLALREGRLTVPGTEGLPPSRELLYFDPGLRGRSVPATPVSPTVPPLYAPIALPFSYLGWRGLVAINILAFLGTLALVFHFARRYGRDERAGWMAAVAFGAGGFAIEYAQGMWPHMLSVFLCTSAVVLAARVRDGGRLALAGAAGLAAGLAAGIRYQNVLFAGCVGLGLLLLARRRWAASAAFAAGVAGPLVASSLINFARLGSWNPVSKGPRYLSGTLGGSDVHPALEFVHVLWTRVVDFSAMPPLAPALARVHVYMWKDPSSGAWVLGSAVKKAWLQSSPWVALALVFLALAWLARSRRPAVGPGEGARRELRALALIVFPVVAAFAVAGFRRLDGLCFNQRYFLELVPLAAVAFAWALEGLELSRPRLLLGTLVATSVALVTSRSLAGTALEKWLWMQVPLVLGALLLLLWVATLRGRRPAPLALTVGLCLGWALGVHWFEDLPASRKLRKINYRNQAAMDRVLPERAALFAYWGMKDAFGPLQLDRDLVIVDPWPDEGNSANALVDALLDQQRPVFVVVNGFPEELIARMARGRVVRGPARVEVDRWLPLGLLELRRAAP